MIRLLKGLIIWGIAITAISSIEIKELPSRLTLSSALYNHCLELTQSQQLFKEYIFIGLKNRYKNPEKSLPISIEKYDKRLKTLQAFFHTKFTDEKDKKTFDEGGLLWEKVKKLLQKPPTKENALLLQKTLSHMYKKLKATKVLLTKSKSFQPIKITGRLCYLSQDMANLYLLAKAWHIQMPDYQKKMQAKMAEFEKKLATLKKLPINTPNIQADIESVEKAYSYFAYMYNAKTAVIPTLIGKKSDDIFKKIELVKRNYGELLKKN